MCRATASRACSWPRRSCRPGGSSTVASQTDIAPTILALLGGSYEHCFLGRNVLAVGGDEGFAVIHDENYLAFVRDDLALVAPPRHEVILYEVSGKTR